MRLTFLIRSWSESLWRDERGVVLAVALVVMVVLMGVSSTALFSGYTNMVTSTNLRLATQARATAETAVNEALFRLSRQEGQPGAIAPDLTQAFWNDPNWQVEIMPDGSSNPPAQVATIQNVSDWGGYASDTPPVTLRYKKPDPTGAPNNVLFYDRTQNPPFITITLPAALGAIPDTARPVVQILATGLDEREAERQILAEAAETVAFAPPAPLSSGVDVNLNGTSFIDGVNHHHMTLLNPGSAVGDKYGDDSDEITYANTLRDSPDDHNLDSSTGPGPKPCGPGPAGSHGIANPSLSLPPYTLPPYSYTAYTSCPRLYNKQISSTDSTPAWVGSTWNSVTGTWSGINSQFASAIALSNGPTVTNDNPPPNGVWTTGVFSWHESNVSGLGTIPTYPSSCSSGATLVCRPPQLTPFPTFQQFLGLDDVSFQKLLDKPDTCGGTGATCSNVLSATVPPQGFTYVKMASASQEYVWDNTFASPNTDEFGLFYVNGSLRINGHQTFKGLIFIEGSLTITGNPTVLGAMMVRGSTNVTAGTGNMTLLYSRKAAEIGIQAGHPWRILSWEDTEMAQ